MEKFLEKLMELVILSHKMESIDPVQLTLCIILVEELTVRLYKLK